METLSGFLLAVKSTHRKTSENKTWRRYWLQFSRSTKDTSVPAPLGPRGFGNQMPLGFFEYPRQKVEGSFLPWADLVPWSVICVSPCVTFKKPISVSPQRTEMESYNSRMSQEGLRSGGIIFPLIGPPSALLPAAVLSHLCYWIQRFLATGSKGRFHLPWWWNDLNFCQPPWSSSRFILRQGENLILTFWKQTSLLHPGNFQTWHIHQFSFLTNIWQNVSVKTF